MSRPVRWSTDALADLADQIAYIAADNPAAARRMADALDKTALALGDMPIGRPGRVTGTYEKSVTGLSYILAYAITQTAYNLKDCFRGWDRRWCVREPARQ